MDFIIYIISSFWFQAILKLIVGFILSGIIGLERSSWNKPAGFRTHSLVGLSSVLIMLCGEYMSEKYNIDPSRIPAQLLSGIGFIGAGTILRDGFNVKGLTTAARAFSSYLHRIKYWSWILFRGNCNDSDYLYHLILFL